MGLDNIKATSPTWEDHNTRYKSIMEGQCIYHPQANHTTQDYRHIRPFAHKLLKEPCPEAPKSKNNKTDKKGDLDEAGGKFP